MGRTDELKGAVLLLEAMRAVWKWNERARLILAGPLPDESGEMAKCMRKLGQEERERIVQIHDFSEEEKASIYDSFDVFVLPSIAESFGIAYLEAWMCEKPVIGGRIGSTQSVIQEHVDGLLADNPFNPDDLARQIILLLKDRSMRRRMGQAGLAKTLSMHTWEKVVDRVEQTYQEVIDFQTEAAQCMKVAS